MRIHIHYHPNLLGAVTKGARGNQFLLPGAIYYICLISIAWFTVKVIEKKSLKSIGLSFHGIIKKVALGIGIFAVLTLFHIAYLLYGVKFNLADLGLPTIILRTLYYMLLVGFAEELVFRGYLLERLNELLKSKIFAVILSSAIFALWHYPSNFNVGQVVFAFLFGIVLSTIRVRIKSDIIVSLAVAHGLFNSYLLWIGYFVK